MAGHVLNAALNPQIIRMEYGKITNHIEYLKQINNSINRIAFAIEVTQNYSEQEIETVVNLMKEAYRSELELISNLHKRELSSIFLDDTI